MKTRITIFIIFSSLLLGNLYSQWVKMPGSSYGAVYCFTASGNNIFAGSSGNGVYFSPNSGSGWTHNALNNQTILSLASNVNNIFAGGLGIGVYISTNSGANWTQTSLINNTVHSLYITGINIFAGTDVNGVFLSTNNGANWTQTSLNNQTVYSLCISGNNIYAGTDGNGVFLSTNNGISWTQTSLNNQIVHSIAVNGTNIFAGISSSTGGIYLSTNNGLNWVLTPFYNLTVNSIIISSSIVFAGTSGGGIYYSTNNGNNWIQKNEGFLNPPPELFSLFITNNYIFAGSGDDSNAVYRRSYLEIIGIKNIYSNIPDWYSLSQNYPNPFNPSTTIEFALAKSANVKLAVYDLTGREVDVLVNEELKSGNYKVYFDGNKRTSGIYFYRLVTNDASSPLSITKKMVMVK